MANIDEPIRRFRHDLEPGTAEVVEEQAFRRSALEAATCLYRYNQIYNLGVEDASDVSLRGVLFHAAAELYVKMLTAARVESDYGIAVEAFQTAAERCAAPARVVIEAERLFFWFVERFELKWEHVLHVEQTLITVRHGRRFTWKPDLVYVNDRGIVFYDWKTHFTAWTLEQARQEFQSRFYLLMALEHFPGHPRYEICFLFVRANILIRVVFSLDEFAQIERQVDAALGAIAEADASGTYPATGGPHCQYCRLECPINGRGGLLPTRVDDQAQFDALASEYLALKQRQAQTRKLLKQFVAVEGPREVNGMRWGHTAHTRSRYPVVEVQAVAAEHGVSVEGLTVAGGQIRYLLDERRRPAVARELQRHAITETSYRFGATKTGAFILGDRDDDAEDYDDED
jgi:hypothetical protein